MLSYSTTSLASAHRKSGLTSDWPSSASRCLWDTSRLAFTANPPRSLRESRKNTARSVSRGEADPPVARSSALTALPAPRTPTALADFAYPTSSALLVSAVRSDWKLSSAQGVRPYVPHSSQAIWARSTSSMSIANCTSMGPGWHTLTYWSTTCR